MAKKSKNSVAKVIEISADSPKSFEDAVKNGGKKASKTVKNMRSAWSKDQQVEIVNGEVVGYRVNMKVTFEIS